MVASGCVFNNYLDRSIDQKMSRTKKRAIAVGLVSVPAAISYASILGLIGIILLYSFTNLLTSVLALLGLFVYVVIYGIWKRRSIYGTIVGSISGAIPPVVGYCAVSVNFDLGAIILFLILVFWQMPHFYAIAIYRLKDYTAAGIPVLPAIKGLRSTKLHMLGYIIAFLVTSTSLALFGYAGYFYMIVAVVLSVIWLRMCLHGFSEKNSSFWARQMFRYSLVVITVLCITISSNVFWH